MSIDKNQIKAVIFDIDGTLFDHPGAENAVLLDMYEAENSKQGSFEEFLDCWKESQEIYYNEFAAHKISFEEHRQLRVQRAWTFFDRDVDLNESKQIFDRFLKDYEKHWRLYPDSLPCLEKLAEYKLGVITNGMGEWQRKKMKFCGLTNWFGDIVVSGELGVSKPAKEIFMRSCENLGVSPGEAIYVGDRLDIDAHAAAEVGMYGVWVARYGEEGKLQSDRVFRIENLDALTEWLG